MTQETYDKRWKALGGVNSILGRPKGAEYSVAGGRARRFEHGRMFYKSEVGTRELFGRVLTAYVKRGGPTSRLGFPTTRPLKSGRNTFARFQHGLISVRPSGRVRVTYS